SGAPTIADGKAYVGSPYTDSFFAFDVKTGKKLWEYRVNAKVKGAPVIQGGLVFFGDTKGYLHVLDATTGRAPRNKQGCLVLERRVGGSLTNAKSVALSPGGPIIVNNDLFVGSQDGFVYRISIPHWLASPQRTLESGVCPSPGD
ncbi:MAG: PQQ-binding-like beta-propeller repeat protein, partial [Gammaproteobacteria bacterium]